MGAIEEIIEFWFGGEDPFRKWFSKDPAFDAQVRERFGDLHARAARGELDAWRGDARGELALLVLLDQFSRNMFRDDPRAFATDDIALQIARDLLASGRANELTSMQQMVALLPFQHAEDRTVQAEGVAAYERLVAAHPENTGLPTALDFAKRHRDIIERFGRFPHRNAVLGRTSTPDEIEFLTQPGSSF